MTRQHVDTIGELGLAQLRIEALRAGYVSGEFGVRAVVSALRERALNDAHNAWIYVLAESELAPYIERLEQVEPHSLPLYGVPFAVKDNIDIAGIKTTAACPAFSYVASETATVVSRLINAGAIPLGKTNLDQFATGLVGTRSPYGETHNAFTTTYISGGSSSGSAVATALGQVSFALGTDTAGSGRVPPALNNLIGHKPSHGLVSTFGVVPACRSLDCVSIMATTVDDVAAVLEQAISYDQKDAYSRPNKHYNARDYLGQPPAAFDFAIPDELDFDGDKEAQALFEQTIEALQQLGGTARTIPFEPFYTAAKLLYEGPWVAERRLAVASVATEHRLPVIEQVLRGGSHGSNGSNHGLSAEATFEAFYKLRALKQTCDTLLQPYDFVLTPTTPTVYTRAQLSAAPIELNSRLGTYTNFMNLLDYAATAVPVGMLPGRTSWGVTLFSQRDTDYRLLGFARALQTATNLPLGASDAALPSLPDATARTPFNANIELAVCGAHLSGQPLNWQLTSRGATLIEATQSQACYSLYALPDGKRPALLRDNGGGIAIDLEVWSVPHDTLGSFVDGVAEPLAIGKVELADGRWVSGFVCAGGVPEGARNITAYRSWRNWLASGQAAS